uniref:non-specific serine/threonine protein kinase n=1 Tax=Panagrolaimus davidi TaxID=227884 RepID=A0A914NYB4_9BILA
MPRKPIPIGDDSVKAVESGTKIGTPTGSTSNDSKRQKKNGKKLVVKKAEPAKSMKEKQKKKNRRKTIRKHRTPKSQDSKPLIPRPPPSPTPPTAAPPSPPSPKVCAKTQDEYQQSQRPTVKQQQQPVKVPAKREREKVSLNNFLSKPIPSDFDTNDIPIGTEIHTKKYEYKVLKKLGAGGCGETFVVENAKTKNILCAKVEFLNKEDLRLKIEFGIYLVIDKIKRTNKSALPHLLRCLDFGEAKGKAQFLFLPLCQNSLEGYMKTGSPSLATAFELSLQVLEGIKELHSLGYIHRDLKPANIVINAKLTKAYIIDFGMSCTFCTDPAEMPASSNYDFIGTTKYAPREAHKSLPQSRKSDIESWIYVVNP